jgi:hypothetical protein
MILPFCAVCGTTEGLHQHHLEPVIQTGIERKRKKGLIAIIMAGGLGKRMESHIPKVLHKINNLSEAGFFSEFISCKLKPPAFGMQGNLTPEKL